MSGVAIVIKGADFSALNVGKITFLENIPIGSISIVAESSYTGEKATLSASYLPINTNQIGVTWSIESGNDYASIDSSTGVLTIKQGVVENSVVIKATSIYNPDVFSIKTITLTYSDTVDILNSIIITGDTTISKTSYQFGVVYDPANTSNKGVIWSITNGGSYASIDQSGLMTINPGTTSKTVIIRATSNSNSAIYGELTATVTYSVPPISFVSPEIKAICVNHWDTDKNGELSMAEAASVINISNFFAGTTGLSFNEFKYFTGLNFDLVESVPYQAFLNVKIQEITFPPAKTISSDMFSSNHTSSIIIAHMNGVISLGANTIKSNAATLTTVDGLESVTTLSAGVFQNCTKLTTVGDLNSVVTIGGVCFENSGLDHIIIGDKCTNIAYGAFNNCANMRYMKINATTPPTLGNNDAFNNSTFKIYVPDASLSNYQASWGSTLNASTRIKAMSSFATDFPNN